MAFFGIIVCVQLLTLFLHFGRRPAFLSDRHG